MALSHLNSDGIKVSDNSIKSGFLEPFYQGMPECFVTFCSEWYFELKLLDL